MRAWALLRCHTTRSGGLPVFLTLTSFKFTMPALLCTTAPFLLSGVERLPSPVKFSIIFSHFIPRIPATGTYFICCTVGAQTPALPLHVFVAVGGVCALCLAVLPACASESAGLTLQLAVEDKINVLETVFERGFRHCSLWAPYCFVTVTVTVVAYSLGLSTLTSRTGCSLLPASASGRTRRCTFGPAMLQLPALWPEARLLVTEDRRTSASLSHTHAHTTRRRREGSFIPSC